MLSKKPEIRNWNDKRLDKDPVACIGVAEFLGDTKLLALKYPVEVGNVIEPAIVGYFGNGMCCFN